MKTVKKTAMLLVTLLLLAVCLTACQTTYAVTYKVTGMEDLTVKTAKGERAVAPQIATAEGVTLDGWYIDQAYTDEYDFEQAVTKDVTLYARFKSTSYAVVYDLAHEAEGAQAPVQESVNYDGTFTVKDAPDRVGYEFKGWTDGEKVYLAGDTYTVTRAETVRLVATWEYRTLTAKFVSNMGEVEKEVPYGADVQPPAAEDTLHRLFCFELVGWEGGSMEKLSSDMTYTAVYDYVPTDVSYFDFALNEDGESYTLKKNVQQTLPAQVALPTAFNGKPVTKMDTGMFFYDFILTELYVPHSYEEGVYAGLAQQLKYLYVEEGVKSLPENAFKNCPELTFVELPASLEKIGPMCFYGCPKLVDIEFAQNSKLVYRDDAIYSADGTKLFWVRETLTEFVIEKEVTWINRALFASDEGFGSTTVSAFKNITINADLKLLPASTFYECFELETVTFNGVIEEIAGYGESGEVEVDPDWGATTGDMQAFHISSPTGADGKLKSLTFKSGLKRIGTGAFAMINCLQTLSLPNTVEEIAIDAFGLGYATNLVSITVTGDASTDAGVIYTDQNNFALYVRNAGLGEGNDKGDLLMYVAKGNSKVTEFTVPDGVTYIGAYSFSGSAYIESVTVPEGITILTGSAFSGMAALKKVTLPVSLKYIKAGILPDLDDNGDDYRRWGGLGTIPQVGPFANCNSLEEVNFEELVNLELIGDGAFRMSALSEIFIPASVKEIRSRAFRGVGGFFTVDENNAAYSSDENGNLYNKDKTLLINISFDGKEVIENVFAPTVDTIADCALDNSAARKYSSTIKKLVIPDNVKYIYSEAFYTNNIEYVVVGRGVEIVGAAAFYITNIDENWATIKNSLTLEFLGETAPVFYADAINPQCLIEIKTPSDSFESYYTTFVYLGLETYLDDSGAKIVTYNFVNTQGENPDSVTAPAVVEMPTAVYGGSETAYFQGWFTKNGSVDGDWGERVKFPYFYHGEGSESTVYAAWGNEKYEDGTSAQLAYTVHVGVDDGDDVIGGSDFKMFNGRVYFTFTAQEYGHYELFGTNEVLFDKILKFEQYKVLEDGSLQDMGTNFVLQAGDTVICVITYSGLPEEGVMDYMFMQNTWA